MTFEAQKDTTDYGALRVKVEYVGSEASAILHLRDFDLPFLVRALRHAQDEAVEWQKSREAVAAGESSARSRAVQQAVAFQFGLQRDRFIAASETLEQFSEYLEGGE